MELVATTEQYRGYFPPRNITERAEITGTMLMQDDIPGLEVRDRAVRGVRQL